MTQTTTPQKRGALARIAHFTVTHRRSVMLVWLVVAFAAAPLALTLTKALSGAGWEAQGSDAQLVRDELRRDFPEAAGGARRRRLFGRRSADDRDAARTPLTP